jgi:hypothetical protein
LETHPWGDDDASAGPELHNLLDVAKTTPELSTALKDEEPLGDFAEHRRLWELGQVHGGVHKLPRNEIEQVSNLRRAAEGNIVGGFGQVRCEPGE